MSQSIPDAAGSTTEPPEGYLTLAQVASYIHVPLSHVLATLNLSEIPRFPSPSTGTLVYHLPPAEADRLFRHFSPESDGDPHETP